MSKVHEGHFESIEEFVTEIMSKPNKKGDGSSEIDKRGWFGTKTFQEALDLVTLGDHQTAEKVSKQFYHIKAKGRAVPTTQYNLQDEGLMIDVSTFIEGQPEYWLNPVEGIESNRKPVAKVMINCCQNAGTSKEAYFTRGAYTLNIIESLEKMGYPVEVYACFCSTAISSRNGTDDYSYGVLTIKIKSASQGADLDKIAYAIANVSFFRRLVFRYKETRGMKYRQDFSVPNGYGRARELPVDKRKDAIYIPSDTESWSENNWNKLIENF